MVQLATSRTSIQRRLISRNGVKGAPPGCQFAVSLLRSVACYLHLARQGHVFIFNRYTHFGTTKFWYAIPDGKGLQ